VWPRAHSRVMSFLLPHAHEVSGSSAAAAAPHVLVAKKKVIAPIRVSQTGPNALAASPVAGARASGLATVFSFDGAPEAAARPGSAGAPMADDGSAAQSVSESGDEDDEDDDPASPPRIEGDADDKTMVVLAPWLVHNDSRVTSAHFHPSGTRVATCSAGMSMP
jgi:hypothetical protein